MTKPIQSYWPEYYVKIRDFVELAEAEDVDMQLAQGAVQQFHDDQFVITSGLQAIKRRERTLEIQADSTTETLDFRKRRILNRYRTKPPFTIRYLQQQLDALVGPGMTIVSVDLDNHILTVTANIDNASVFREVIFTVDTIKPANLIYQQNTSIADTIEIEEKVSMQSITWNYDFGSWKLGEKPFATLGTEVPIT